MSRRIRPLTWLVRLLAVLGLSAPVFAVLWVNARTRLSEAERRAAELSGQRDQLAIKVAATQSQLEGATSELVDVKRKAVVSDEHLMFEEAARAVRDESWPAAVELNRRFLQHFPGSAMAPGARKNLNVARKELARMLERVRSRE